MSTPWPGFVGNSYQLDSRYAAIERTVNYYYDPVEAFGETKSRALLSPSPGNLPFSITNADFALPNRGLIQNRGQVFGVNGNIIFEILSTGEFIFQGNCANDGKPVSMVANGNGQVFIASAGLGYYIPAGSGPSRAGQITSPGFLGSSTATFQDGYIIVTTPGSSQFQISGDDDNPTGDVTKWNAANVSIQAGIQDNLAAVKSNQEYLYVLGERRSLIYDNVGNQGIGGFPFQIYNDTILEIGTCAPASVCALGLIAGDTIAAVSQNEDGAAQAFVIEGLRVNRISTFAVEQFWASYGDVSDARGFTKQWKGHVFWQVTFPSANNGLGATWLYDRTVSLLIGKPCWHEATYTDYNGVQHARSEGSHCYAFGRHLVGSTGIDGNPGAIYQLYAPNDNVTPFCDTGDTDGTGTIGNMPIVRDRIAPHLWEGNKRRIFDSIEFEPERGVGLDVAADQPGYDPVIILKWSNDYGKTFGSDFPLRLGKIGENELRVIQRRTGKARDRVFWVRCSDPVYSSFSNAELDVRALGV